MRRLPAFVAITAFAAAALVGCSAVNPSEECPRPAASADTAIDAVSVSGDFGAEPSVDVPTPFHADVAGYEDILSGGGGPIRTDTQLVQLNISLYAGATGTLVAPGQYTEGAAAPIVGLAQWTQVIPELADILHCATEGSRVAVALPAGGVVEQAATQLGVAPDDSTVALVDIQKVYLTKADGADQFNDATGMPTVVRAPDGRPGVIVPDVDPPTQTTVQVLKRGDGQPVADGDSVRVNYTGLTWVDKKVFDSSWDGEPTSVTLDGVVPGFAEALRGQTVGSQVLVVIPPDQGYGDQEQGSIPAGSTLVFVIDVLGIDPAA